MKKLQIKPKPKKEKPKEELKFSPMKKSFRIIGIVLAAAVIVFFVLSFVFSSQVSYSQTAATSAPAMAVEQQKVKHLPTPTPLKGIYMTQCVASLPSFREKLIKLIGETELNAVVIDIKDYSGTVSFQPATVKLIL